MIKEICRKYTVLTSPINNKIIVTKNDFSSINEKSLLLFNLIFVPLLLGILIAFVPSILQSSQINIIEYKNNISNIFIFCIIIFLFFLNIISLKSMLVKFHNINVNELYKNIYIISFSLTLYIMYIISIFFSKIDFSIKNTYDLASNIDIIIYTSFYVVTTFISTYLLMHYSINAKFENMYCKYSKYITIFTVLTLTPLVLSIILSLIFQDINFFIKEYLSYFVVPILLNSFIIYVYMYYFIVRTMLLFFDVSSRKEDPYNLHYGDFSKEV